MKVLDFGLAKAHVQASADASEQMTQAVVSSPGIVLGTPAYMAPEQARGETSGRAADVWAFGCVVFELLSGKPPFRGNDEYRGSCGGSQGRTGLGRLARRNASDDSPRAAPLPGEGRSIAIPRCGRRPDCDWKTQPRRRRRSFRPSVPDGASVPRGARRSWRSPLRWILVARQPSSPGERRVDIVTPPEADAGGIALSPDGTKIAYTALNNGVPFLYVRSLENGAVRAIRGNRGRGVAVLVAQWSVPRVLCRKPAETRRPRHRCHPEAGDSDAEPCRRFLEQERHHRVCAKYSRDASSGFRSRAET